MSLLIVGGCGKKKPDAASGTKDGGDAVTADGPAAPAPDAAAAHDAAAAAAPASGIEGRADGVGPLDAKFAVSKESLEKAFPGLAVKHVENDQGGDLRERYWAIAKDGKELLHVQENGGGIEAVDIVSDDVSNPLGVKMGATYADVTKQLGKLECENAGDAVDWRRDVVQCWSEKADQWTLDFVSPEADEAATMLEDPAKLTTATIRAVTWRVPSGPGAP